MQTLTTASPLGQLSSADVAYIRKNYVDLPELCAAEGASVATVRALILDRRLPRPAYVLVDGTPMFSRDALALLRSAGSAEGLPEHFMARFEAVARIDGTAGPARAAVVWDDYLSGEFAVCLRQVTPETIFVKEHLVCSVEALLEAPRSEDAGWRQRLSNGVRGLDALLRPFAACDRTRFGRATSRERLVEIPRARFPWLAVTGRSESVSR